MRNRLQHSGFTLVELLMVVFILSFIVVGTIRLLRDVNQNYTVHTSMTELQQNVRFTFQHLRNVLEEAGAGLPLALSVLELHKKDSLIIVVNDLGGITELSADDNNARPKIAVDSAEKYFGNDSVVTYVPQSATTFEDIMLDSARTQPPDTLFLASQPSGNLKKGGFICGRIRTNRYFVHRSNLCLNSDENVIAENIDSLSISVLDSNLVPVTTDWWEKRVFFSLRVIAGNGKVGRLRQRFEANDTIRFQN